DELRAGLAGALEGLQPDDDVRHLDDADGLDPAIRYRLGHRGRHPGRHAGAEFALTVTGSHFLPSSVIQWHGAPRATTFLGATQLSAVIPASDLTIAG